MATRIDSEAVAGRIRYLLSQARITQARLAERISVDPSNLSKHLSGKLAIGESLVNRIVVDMGVSKSWLRDGVGLPYERGMRAREIDAEMPVRMTSTEGRGVPVYDIDVTAGRAELSRLFTQDRMIGRVDLPQLDDTSVIVHVSGNSMEPVIADGGNIAVRPISDPHVIFWGQIYVVVMEDYRMVKYLRRHDDPQLVILRSANPDYDDMEVPRSDILALYVVESILNFALR